MTTFPRLNCVYLDSAATTLKPACVIEAIADFYRNHDGTVHRAVYSLSREATALYDEARQAVAKFIHSEEEIIFTRGTTASLNLLAQSLRPKKVVVSQTEHHSNIVPWQLVGAEVVPLPINDRGELIINDALFEGADLVSIAHISNVTGTIYPIEEVIAKAHAKGIPVVIDGAQAVGHMPVDVKALDCDFYAFSGHKMYGPTGIGVLYGKRAFLEKMPPVEGGGDMIEKVTFEKSTYNTLPLKFEAGTPMIAQAIGLKAAIDFLQSTDLSHEQELLRYATEKLLTISGLKILGTAEKKAGIISFVIEGAHPLDVATLLDCRGICLRSGHHCSQPTMERFGVTSALRLSFGIYNTRKDIDILYEALEAILQTVCC